MSKAPDCYTGETRDHLSKAASNYTVRAQARSGRGQKGMQDTLGRIVNHASLA
jgi:hypothetical protein